MESDLIRVTVAAVGGKTGFGFFYYQRGQIWLPIESFGFIEAIIYSVLPAAI
jgi:hypothetical protein